MMSKKTPGVLTLIGALGVMAVTAPAHAEAGDWLVRARALAIFPDDSSGPVNPSFPGATVGIDNAYTPEVDVTYMLTDNIGAELIAATSKHNATGAGALAGLPLLSSWVLPPTLTLQYHLAPEASIRPYVGAGVNYTIFYNEKAKSELNDAIGQTNVHLKNGFGWALQAGFDVPINDSLFFNVDVKYIDMDTTARLTTGALVNHVNVDINPIIVGVGIGTKF